jgi:hypothetical protein
MNKREMVSQHAMEAAPNAMADIGVVTLSGQRV